MNALETKPKLVANIVIVQKEINLEIVWIVSLHIAGSVTKKLQYCTALDEFGNVTSIVLVLNEVKHE